MFRTAVLALAIGYLLPSYSILRRLADARDELALNALKVEGSAAIGPAAARDVAALMGVDWQSGELMLNFTASLKFPGRCRLELSSPESTKLLVAVSSNGKRRHEGGELPALQLAVDEVCALLVLRGAGDGDSRAAVEKHLAALKVNTRAISLGRFRGTVAYVLGDTAEGAAQLWVYKDGFAPARIRVTDDKQIAWDVQFFDYTSQAAGEAFPRQLLVSKGGEQVLRLTALKGEPKPKLDDALF